MVSIKKMYRPTNHQMKGGFRKFSDRSDGEAFVVDAYVGRRVNVRVGVRHQPGAGATVPDDERLRHRGRHPVVQLADHRVPVRVHVFRRPGRVLQVPGLRPDQVGILFAGKNDVSDCVYVFVCVCVSVVCAETAGSPAGTS